MLNSAERRERLIRILILRGHATLSELSTELEVCERTVMRDVDALSIIAPIFTVTGRCGGVYMDKNYLKFKPRLKEHEIALLEKIAREIEESGVCSLSDEELKLLKEIIIIYSRNTYTGRS